MGFDARDWGDTRRPRRRRRPSSSDVEPLLAPITWGGRLRLAASAVGDAPILAAARRALADDLDRYCEAQGMTVDPETVRWNSSPSFEDTSTTEITLEATVIPRTDGVWGEIRAALAEDAADRQAATEALTAAAETVHDGLDRLRDARGWWLAHPPPTPSGEPLGRHSPLNGGQGHIPGRPSPLLIHLSRAAAQPKPSSAAAGGQLGELAPFVSDVPVRPPQLAGVRPDGRAELAASSATAG